MKKLEHVWPAHPALCALSVAWVLPVAAVGLLGAAIFAALGWARPRVSEGAIDIVSQGPFARWMAERHWAAFTLGPCIWYWTEETALSRRTRRHEREHVRQFLRWGPLMLLAYRAASAWAACTGGHFYVDNGFERAARRAACASTDIDCSAQ